MLQPSTSFRRLVLVGLLLGGATFVTETASAAVAPTFMWRNPTPHGGSFTAVTFAANRFVAVGLGGRVLTSTDGATWHLSATIPNTDLYGVAFGGNLWVTVGLNGDIFTSPDTVTWTQRTSNTTQSLNSVSYASDRFLAGGGAGTILVSTDGVNWAARTSGSTRNLNGIAGRSGAYVAVGDANAFLISSDTVTWTQVPLAESSSDLQTVAFLANQFVVVGSNGRIYSSPEGTNWTSRGGTAATGSAYRGITHDGSQYIIGINGGTIVVTANLVNRTTTGTGRPRRAFASGAGVTVGVGLGGVIATTTDGREWTTRGSTSQGGGNGVASLNGRWFTVGNAGGFGAIYTSPTGERWTNHPTESPHSLNSIAFGGNRYVAVGDAGYIATSTDGETWAGNTTASSTVRDLSGVAYANGRFVAVGTGGVIITSTDGLAWTTATSGVTTTLNAVVGFGAMHIAIGEAGVILTSTNGTTWARATSGTTQGLRGICVQGGTVYAAGNSLTILASTNGQVWSTRTQPGLQRNSGGNYIAIAPANGGLIAGGTYGIARFSPDGVTWSDLPAFSFRETLQSAASDGTTTILIADNATILQSVDPNAPPARLTNVATRGLVQPGGSLTPGFVLRGTGSKQVVVRAIGPTLSLFGLNALSDLKLDVVNQQTNTTVASNDDWGGSAALANRFASLGAFALGTGSKDAAVQANLAVNQGGYSVRITASGTASSGVALAEVYDADDASSPVRLANVSTLGFVGTDENVLTPGFVISGAVPKQLLIRAVGPSLTLFGLDGVLNDPQFSVFPSGASVAVATSNDWGGTAALKAAFTAAGAFQIPDASKDAAVVVTLPPGGYTVVTSGVGGTTGTALVEIYDLDP